MLIPVQYEFALNKELKTLDPQAFFWAASKRIGIDESTPQLRGAGWLGG